MLKFHKAPKCVMYKKALVMEMDIISNENPMD